MKIAVIGSINIDMVVNVDRIPLKGETLKGSKITYLPGGKGANQAIAMAKLGACVHMFGCVGDDSYGLDMIKNLQNFNVKTDYIKKIKNVPTGIALISVGEQDNTIIIVPGANECVDTLYFDSIKEKILDFDMVVLQCEIPTETIIKIVEYCYSNNIKVTLNPAPATHIPDHIIEKLTYITPNESEFKLIFETDDFDSIQKKYPEKLIITKGAKGVSTCLKNGEILNILPRKTNVVDTTGAGDTLNGAFCVKILEDNIKNALVYANVAASISIEKFGAQAGMPTKKDVVPEFEKFLKECNL